MKNALLTFSAAVVLILGICVGLEAFAEQRIIGERNPSRQTYVQETQPNGTVLIWRVSDHGKTPVQPDDDGLAWWLAQGNTLAPAKPYVKPVEAKPEVTAEQAAQLAAQDEAVDAAAKAALDCLILLRVGVDLGTEDPCAAQREAYLAAKDDAARKVSERVTIVVPKTIVPVEVVP